MYQIGDVVWLDRTPVRQVGIVGLTDTEVLFLDKDKLTGPRARGGYTERLPRDVFEKLVITARTAMRRKHG